MDSGNFMFFLCVTEFVAQRRDIENVFDDFDININAVKVAVFEVVPTPDRFTYAFACLSLLDSIMTNITRNQLVSFRSILRSRLTAV